MNINRLYGKVGEAIHLAQTLELSIAALVSVLNRQFNSRIDEQQIILGNDRRTLGQLIREMKKHGDFNREATETLSKALEARNYVAHHFFNRNVEALRSEAGCTLSLALLDKRTKQIAAATAVMGGFVQCFCQTFKIKLSDLLVRQEI